MGRELSAGKAHPFLSNIGVIDPAIVDFRDAIATDFQMFGPVAFPPNFLVVGDPRLVDAFFDFFIHELPAIETRCSG